MKCWNCKKELEKYAYSCSGCHRLTKYPEKVELHPNDGSANYYRHMASRMLNEKKISLKDKEGRKNAKKKAIPYLIKAIELEHLKDDYLHLATDYAIISDYENSIKTLKTALILFPNDKMLEDMFDWVEREAKFFKKSDRERIYIHRMIKEGKIDIKTAEKDEYGTRVFVYINKKGKRLVYNLDEDYLMEYDDEAWMM